MESTVIIVIISLAIILMFSSIKQISPNQRGVRETFSRFDGVLDPGIKFIFPIIQTVKIVDIRERVVNTHPQEMITKDNAVVTVDSVIYVQIVDVQKAVYEIQDPILAVMSLCSTNLRSIIGNMKIDEVLGERQKINAQVQTELSSETAKWGIKVLRLEIQRIDPPRELMDAMNTQKIAEQQKRAKILKAEGEREAAIAEAQGQRESQILKAEGERQKTILEAEGQATAMETLANAKAKALELEAKAAAEFFQGNAVLKEQFKVLEESLKNNSKYILDSDILSVFKSFISKQ